MSVVGETVLSARGDKWVITRVHAIAAMQGFALGKVRDQDSSTAVMLAREGQHSVTLEVKVPLAIMAVTDVQSAFLRASP